MQNADGSSIGGLEPVALQPLVTPDGLEQAFRWRIIFVAQDIPRAKARAPVGVKIFSGRRHCGLLLRPRLSKVKPAISLALKSPCNPSAGECQLVVDRGKSPVGTCDWLKSRCVPSAGECETIKSASQSLVGPCKMMKSVCDRMVGRCKTLKSACEMPVGAR
jgi:hypothetical protein